MEIEKLISNIKQLELLVFYLVNNNNAGKITLERMFVAIYKDLENIAKEQK